MADAPVEDYSLHVVPRSWRSSTGALAMAFYAIPSAAFYLIISGTIALAVGSRAAIVGMVLAALVTGAINIAMSRQAIRGGLTVNLFSRALFGHAGATLATLVFAATAIYYAVFESSVIAAAFHAEIPGLDLKLWYLIVVAYSVPLVLGGVHAWLDRLNRVLLPFYVLGLLAAIVIAIAEHGYDGSWASHPAPAETAVGGPGWLFAFTSYMGVWIQMMFTMDYARYGRPEEARRTSFVVFGPVFYLIGWVGTGLIGLFLMFTIPTEGTLTETSGVLGLVSLMGWAGVALIWVSQTRINTANFYLASTNVQNVGARLLKLDLSRRVWLGVVGVVVFLLMLTDVFSYINEALRVQGVLVVAWVGVALSHVLRTRGAPVEFRPGRVRRFNPVGLGAWSVAAAVGLILLYGAGETGKTWAPLAAFLLSAAVYNLAFSRADAWALLRRPLDPRDEVDDPWEVRIACHVCDRSYVAQEMDRDPSHGHAAICAGCAVASPTFYVSAAREADGARPAAPAATALAD
ncbi:purine-cytosine permease family protein [Patulibacter sp. S7RM1-6]